VLRAARLAKLDITIGGSRQSVCMTWVRTSYFYMKDLKFHSRVEAEVLFVDCGKPVSQ
jgi:hypothetical protein